MSYNWLDYTGFKHCIEDGCNYPAYTMISLCGDERWACYKHYDRYIQIMHVSESAARYVRRGHFYKDRIGAFGYLPKPGARTIQGITYGPQELAFVKEVGTNYEIWKSFGHTSWSSIGETTYVPASYKLVNANNEDSLVSVIVSVTAGWYWRRGIGFLEEYYGNFILRKQRRMSSVRG